ncbi:hypothetical protein DMC30DRAFT_417366 [Rhodotorula diobovata]|uniref:DUF6534 domain-containing protein n=1 Tax=Rhodotorula diobovata TaxID=5288 RepID=A0A5C5FUK0_9BASI|nr:hypothetical protein DMC30DRAFT_417366 [Rhodotorula diobovata]
MPDIVDGFGPFYLGVLLNVALTLSGGINWMQLLEYFARPVVDRPLVLAVFLISTAHTAVSCHIVWYHGIEHFGDASKLADCVWSFAVDPLLTALVAAIIQAHYAWRVYLVGGRRPWMPALILVLTLLQLGMGTYVTAGELVVKDWVEIHRLLDPFVGTWLFSMVAADVVITGALTFRLSRVRSEFDTTNTLLGRIVRNIVANNALTAATAITSAVLFVASKSTCWHVAPGLTLARFYTLSFLSSLNSRQSLQGGPARRPSVAPMAAEGPKPFWLDARSPGSPPAAHRPPRTGPPPSPASSSHLSAHPALGRICTSESGTSSLSEKERRQQSPALVVGERDDAATVPVPESLPTSIQIESDVTDELPRRERPFFPGDPFDASRLCRTPSMRDDRSSDSTALDMGFVHAIEADS